METLKIVALCLLAAIAYGMLHDQVTARLCVEYFTIGHPPVFDTDSPTLLALGWGVIATWWVGFLLALPAALAARIGRWPRISAQGLYKPIAALLVMMALASFVAGGVGYLAAHSGRLFLYEPLASAVPQQKHALFLADAGAHLAAYAVGIFGGLALCPWILWRRKRLSHAARRQGAIAP